MRVNHTLRTILAGVALVAATASCGGASDQEATEPTPTVDPAIDFRIDLGGGDDDDGFRLPPLDPDAVAEHIDGEGAGGTGNRSEPPPLDDIVIDQGGREDPGVGVLLDEATALACAHTEFALDAVFAGDDSALADAVATAAEFAASSSDEAVVGAITALGSRVGDDDVADAVIDALRACTAAGYEL